MSTIDLGENRFGFEPEPGGNGSVVSGPDQRLGVVLVSGGASGLGRSIAEGVAYAGGTPVILDRRPDEGGFDGEVVDLEDAREAEASVERLVKRHGRLDSLVTAAGTDSCGPLSDVAGEDWDRVVKVNLLGTAAVIRAALPFLSESRGRIVTVGSTLAQRALPDATAYCASKFGVLGLSRALAAELSGRVGVTCLMPGGMDTSFFDGRPDRYRPGDDADLADPRTIADTALFVLGQSPGVDIREVLVCPSGETSWP